MASLFSLIFLGGIAGGLIVAVVRAQSHTVKLTDESWKSLVGKLQKIDNDGVTAVAHDFLNPCEGMFVLQPEQIWNAVGGYTGLAKMRDNAQIMIALAAFVREFDFNSSVIVGERMRRDAVLLRRCVRRLELAQARHAIFGKVHARAVFDIQQAAASYYLMRERLFALYKISLDGMYPALSQAL